ncbi:Ppx/GppA family phosphatase [Lysobacter sp. GX 14042]|uniref:Ppx/GppA phosphatase family protein n=1 Tax=Lysobacter sp. GX 14042 TaxID=2907155 RepID=UPI001F1F5F7E|nr:Ppx/GppA phosphatase family protein [Lysobacter sp. GX 14042]MCE7032497.1 Ppx/GppA family phosphatase [Lysobacter sp. GX 14042]
MKGTLPGTATPLQDGELLAAVDLGSNSFHMVVAQSLLGQLRVVDRLRETVRLGEGLDARGSLSREARTRAFDCLSRFGQRIRDIPPHRVRALATNTVRRLAAPQAFLMPAESALGHAIEVVSGREEARLVYLGVAHAQPPAPGKLRLVIDIGGGSTEFIIGSGLDAIERESLQLGSIATTRRFFADGRLDRRRWDEALTEVLAEFQQFAGNYRALGWDDAIGSSGTNKAIGAICAELGLTKGAITAAALPQVRDAMLAARRIEAIDLPGLGSERRPIIAGGLLVLEAAFQALGLERLMTSKAAMREGVLYDMVGRGGADDPRGAAVDALMSRYGIDRDQARRVEATALRLFDQLSGAWGMDHDDRLLLARAARLHEVGLTIAHSQYHIHGAYVVEHSDIAGFSRQQQQFLAALVRTQRRKIPRHAFDALPDRLLPAARHNAALLRLAVLIHRGHEADPVPRLVARADGPRLQITFDRHWLEARPLLRADLEGEPAAMAALGVELHVAVD